MEIEPENFTVTIIDDENVVLKFWKEKLGSEKVFCFNHPDDFMLAFSDNENVRKTNLIITDFYFDNISILDLLDFKMLKKVLKFQGKIFVFSNVMLEESSEFCYFDYIFPDKVNFFNKKYLFDLFNSKNVLQMK